jgi:hypothetical protein
MISILLELGKWLGVLYKNTNLKEFEAEMMFRFLKVKPIIYLFILKHVRMNM